MPHTKPIARLSDLMHSIQAAQAHLDLVKVMIEELGEDERFSKVHKGLFAIDAALHEAAETIDRVGR